MTRSTATPSRSVTGQLEVRPADLHVVGAGAAAELIAPAADAVSDEEQARIVAEAPRNLLAVLQGEGRGGAVAGRTAGARIRELVTAGHYVHVGRALAFHELSRGGHRQLGLVAEVPVTHEQEGRVRGHEATRRDLEEALTAFVAAAGVDASPVALTYRARADVDTVAAEVTARPPRLDVVGRDGLRHRLWVVDDPALVARLATAFAAVDQLTIVDGHHRVAAARRRGSAGDATFLAVLYPDRDLAFASHDRCVETDVDPEHLAAALADLGRFEPVPAGDAGRPRDQDEIRVLLEGRWYALVFRDVPGTVPAGLAPTLLQERILRPLLGVDDPRDDDRLTYVPGTEPLETLAARCAGGGRVAFVLPPITLDQLQQVAAAGEVLPPKSTYSDPKPGPGLVLRLHPRTTPAQGGW